MTSMADAEGVKRVMTTEDVMKSASHATFIDGQQNVSHLGASGMHHDEDWSIDLNEDCSPITVKALLAGSLVGTLCSFLALYYSLKTGVVPSLNILSGLGGFILVRGFLKVGLFRERFTPQENAVIQTVSVAAYAFATVGIGFGSSYLGMSWEAFVDAGGEDFTGNYATDTVVLDYTTSLLWCIALGFFGFFLAFPIRDYSILKQRLPFPSGTVTAYVIKNMHDAKAKTGASFALLSKFFSIGYCVNLLCWAFSGLDEFPIFGLQASQDYGWALDWDIGSFGIGALLPMQVSGSMLFGAIVAYGILQPCIKAFRNGTGPNDWVDLENIPSSFLGLQAYAVFCGMAVMLVTGIWTIGTLFVTIVKDLRRPNAPEEDAENGGHIRSSQTVILENMFRQSQMPAYVPYVGYLCFGALCVVLLHVKFNVDWYKTLVALCVLPLFAISNIQGMGKTDWDVSSTYGKIMMFPFGAWSQHSVIPSLAVCAVTIAGCSNCATLMQDFKTGMLVGCSPTLMFFSQLFGAVVGCLICPALFVLLRSTFTLPNSQDPSAFLQGRYGTIYRVLAVVATGSGFSALPKNVLWFALAFAVLTVILLAVHTWGPPKYTQWIPDPSAMSIGILVPASVSLEFFMGGMIVWWWARHNAEATKKVPYIASGCVAGSGLGVVTRCLLSLVSVNPPVNIDWTSVGQKLNAGKVIAIVVFMLIFLLVAWCGAWYWNFEEQEEDEDAKDEAAPIIVEGLDDGVEMRRKNE